MDSDSPNNLPSPEDTILKQGLPIGMYMPFWTSPLCHFRRSFIYLSFEITNTDKMDTHRIQRDKGNQK